METLRHLFSIVKGDPCNSVVCAELQYGLRKQFVLIFLSCFSGQPVIYVEPDSLLTKIKFSLYQVLEITTMFLSVILHIYQPNLIKQYILLSPSR